MTELMSRTEEVDLARRVEAGVLAQAQLDGAGFGVSASEAELQQLVAEGQVAREQLMRSHTGLVIRIAQQAARRGPVAMADLVQEGFVAMGLALQRYDVERGPFGAYAAPWIRLAIRDATLTRCGDDPWTARRMSLVVRAKMAEQRMWQRLGREVEATELAAELGVDVTTMRRGVSSFVSLDGMDVSDQGAEAAFEATLESVCAASGALRRDIDRLPRIERTVLVLRYGLDGAPLSTTQIGEQLSLSGRTIRRIEARALGALRSLLESHGAAA